MIEKLCNDIYTLFLSETKEDKQKRLSKAYELSGHFFRNSATLNSLKHLFELELKLLHVKGAHKQFIEKKIFYILTNAALGCLSENSENKHIVLSGEFIEHERSKNEQQRYLMALQLVGFVIEIFHFKKERDTFSTQRKALVLEILTILSQDYDIPKAYDLSVLCLKSNKREIIFAALEYLKDYHSGRAVSSNAEVVKLLDRPLLRKKEYSAAVSALELHL